MPISEADLEGFARTRTIDLTTFGRRTGLARRIEIWWFHVDESFIITGTPGRRDWLANVTANPNVIIHVGQRDFLATVSPVHEEARRRAVFTQPDTRWYTTQAELDELLADAPMVEVHFDREE